MSLLRDSLQLMGTPSGGLAYHLVTLFAIQLILGVAIGHWQRRRDEWATRLLVMGLGLFLARAGLMLTALVGLVGLTPSDTVVPPLERFVHLTTVALTVWAFLPIAQRFPRGSTAVLLTVGLVGAGTYAAFATLWPGAEAAGIAYNSYWQQTVWGLSMVAALALVLVFSLLWPGTDHGWLVCLLFLWLVAHTLQLIAPATDAHMPGWVRLGDLAALPLLAGLVYRRALAGASAAVVTDEDLTRGLVGVLQAVQRIADGGASAPALELAASSLSRGLGADMVAIGLYAPDTADTLHIAALHSTTSVALADHRPSLTVSDHPLLARAFESRHLEEAAGGRHGSSVTALYHHLGFDRPGPLLAQPLARADQVLGIVLAGNPDSGREWDLGDQQMLQAMVAPLAPALSRDTQDEGPLDGDLEQARAEAQRLAERAEQLQVNLERQRQRTEELATRMRLQHRETASEREVSAALALWEDEVRELALARDALNAQLTHWRQKAERLAEAKAGLEAQLIHPSPVHAAGTPHRLEGFLVSDETGRIILVSPGVDRLLGQGETELMGTSLDTLFGESPWTRAVTRLLKGHDEPSPVTTLSVTKGGQPIRVQLAHMAGSQSGASRLAAILYTAQASPPGWQSFTSRIRKLQIRTTAIAGYTDQLMDETKDGAGGSRSEALAQIAADVNRMESLLAELIVAAPTGPDTWEIVPDATDVADVIQETLRSLSGRLKEKQLSVHTELMEDLPCVYADRDHLRIVLHNLFSNAILASRPGTAVELQARVEEQPGKSYRRARDVLISITDTGGGIAPEDQPHVFQHFFGTSNPLIEGLGEAGAGLFVARAFVEANAGRIWVESERETGSTFSVMLPLVPEQGLRKFGPFQEVSEVE